MADYGNCVVCGSPKKKRGTLCKQCEILKHTIKVKAPGWRWVYKSPPPPDPEKKQ